MRADEIEYSWKKKNKDFTNHDLIEAAVKSVLEEWRDESNLTKQAQTEKAVREAGKKALAELYK